jgi:hypothetical protein
MNNLTADNMVRGLAAEDEFRGSEIKKVNLNLNLNLEILSQ